MQEIYQLIEANFVIAVIGACFLVGMLLKTLSSMASTLLQERSRREIAAYIAEGTISAEQGERLLRAGISRGGPRC